MFQESIIAGLLLKRNNGIRKYYCSLTLQESMKVPTLKKKQCFKKLLLQVDPTLTEKQCFNKFFLQVDPTFKEKEYSRKYYFRLTLLLSCSMKFNAYPHDMQLCHLSMESCE
jgi:hypothetical protein